MDVQGVFLSSVHHQLFGRAGCLCSASITSCDYDYDYLQLGCLSTTSLCDSVNIATLYRDMATRRIFWGFCINRFGLGPLDYISSSSDFGFEFAEIFVIEKLLPDSASRGVNKIAYRYNFFQAFKKKSMVIEHYIPGLFFAKLVL
jgi:hypothetical protein